MRPVVFSASSLNTYMSCHLQWYFTYVLLEEEEESEPKAVGMAVHDAAEKILRGEVDPGIDAINDVPALVSVFITDILPTYRKPLLVERFFTIEIDGIPFSGVIDSLDEQDTQEVLGYDARILRDLKTTKSRPQPGRYRLNMTGYWLGATDLGYEPHAAQLDWIVRTKKPYYWPEVVPPIDEYDVAHLSGVLHGVARGVESGDWEPTGLGTLACSSCGHKAICGPYQRYQEMTNPIREEAR